MFGNRKFVLQEESKDGIFKYILNENNLPCFIYKGRGDFKSMKLGYIIANHESDINDCKVHGVSLIMTIIEVKISTRKGKEGETLKHF